MKSLILLVLTLVSFVASASQTAQLLSAKTTTGAGNSHSVQSIEKTFQCAGRTTASTGSATIKIQASNDATLPWLDVATITLTLGTTDTADGFSSAAQWKFNRANVTAISGTGANVDCVMGY